MRSAPGKAKIWLKTFSFHPPPSQGGNFDIPIFQRVYDFYKELYFAQIKFPKTHRYTLGQTLNTSTLDLYELLILASREQKGKFDLLERANTKLETLKLLLRLAKDSQAIDSKKYLHLESFLQEIGKMLGGWIKHAKQIARV